MNLNFRMIALVILCVFFTSCQSLPNIESSTNYSPEPKPYEEDEFPNWSKDLRRAEIVTLGSIPFTVLASTLGYGFVRYAQNDFSSDYIPNPFSPSFSADEQVTVMITAAGLSLAVGIGDFIVSLVKRKQEEKQRALESEDRGNIIIEKQEKQ